MVTQIPFASFPNPILKSTVKHKHLVSKVVSENLFCFSKIHGNANSVLHQEKKCVCTSLYVNIWQQLNTFCCQRKKILPPNQVLDHSI